MNKQIITVMFKEIKDNFRDRKTLMSSILMGSVFMPVLFVLLMNFAINMQKDKAEADLEIALKGSENAQSFVHFLKTKGAVINPFSGDPEEAIKNKEQEAVLVIPEIFASSFSEGKPARIKVYYDATAKGATNITQQRIKSLIREYSNTIGFTRIQLRGISPLLFQAVIVEDHDVSTPQSKGASAMIFLPYVFILSLFLGSTYLAIDTMAGEKERNSLEALFLNPIKRSHLLIGKLMATISFGLITLVGTMISFKLVIPFMPLEDIGMPVNLGFKNMISLLLVLAPLTVLAASLQTTVVTYSNSFKEAQTYLGILNIVPMIPSMALMFLPLKEKLWMMTIPVLSQNLVINQIMRGEEVALLSMLAAILGSLFVGFALALAAIKLYKREGLLFSS